MSSNSTENEGLEQQTEHNGDTTTTHYFLAMDNDLVARPPAQRSHGHENNELDDNGKRTTDLGGGAWGDPRFTTMTTTTPTD